MAKDNTAAAPAATAAPAAATSAPAATASAPATATVAATSATTAPASVVQGEGTATISSAQATGATPAEQAAWEYAGRKLSAGYALTAEDVEALKSEVGRGTLMHKDYTQKTQRLADYERQMKSNLARLYNDPTTLLEMFPREYQAQLAAMLNQQDYGDLGEVDPRDVKIQKIERQLSEWKQEGKKQALMTEITSICQDAGDVEPEEVLMEMARGNPAPTKDIVELIKARNDSRFAKWIESRNSKKAPPAPTPGHSVTIVGKEPTTLEDAKARAMRRMGAV